MDFWVIEWSGSQGCFHTDRLKKSLERNLASYFAGRSNDYQIIGIGRSQEEASRFVDVLRREVKKAA